MSFIKSEVKKFGKLKIKQTTPDTKKTPKKPAFRFVPKSQKKHGESAFMPIQDESSTSL